MGRLFKDMVVVGIGALAGLYLINPTAGLFEFIPDVLPVVGNLDEATATLLVINVFRYYGLDVTRLLGSGKDVQLPSRPTRDPNQQR
jgi:hypothetical protein